MISTRLKQFLDDNGVGYDVMHHDPAFTAQELAARLHVPGREFTKAVVVKTDAGYLLVALPAPLRINFKMLAKGMGVKKCRLANETEFQQLFPDCELGAMPPFGNLYNMPTYVDQDVALNENIVINAGTHAEAIRLRYADFARLARPRLIRFGEPPPAEIAAKKKAARAQKKGRKGKPKARAKGKKKAKAPPRKKKARARKKSRRR
jgi:Ala-tRNA(Pro) deacylase